ncbi:MAG TPA: putative toxin-antitoxin system toxin component, PIN family [Bacteroidota bacterium]|nr:putative toxin-antitoxin system toxin component, PIN family [Bacteroidota bacterium]
MDNIVLDTNIVVSALIGKGNPRRILERVIRGDVRMFVSTPIMYEYRKVLRRPKFAWYPDFHLKASDILRLLTSIATTVEPAFKFDVCPDSDDNKFLETAVEAKADYLITGNKKHFPSSIHLGVQIVSPSEYMRLS